LVCIETNAIKQTVAVQLYHATNIKVVSVQ
jgi:hypothetical protein